MIGDCTDGEAERPRAARAVMRAQVVFGNRSAALCGPAAGGDDAPIRCCIAGLRGEPRMIGPEPDTRVTDRGASRRQFFKAAGGQPVSGLGPGRACRPVGSGPSRESGSGARRSRSRGTALHRERSGRGAVVGATWFHPRSGPRIASPECPARSVDWTGGRLAGRCDQRLGLRAGGACQQSAPALGLPAHGGRRLRDEKGEPRGIPAPDASPPTTRRRGVDGARHVGLALLAGSAAAAQQSTVELTVSGTSTG